MQTLSVWKSLKFAIRERVNLLSAKALNLDLAKTKILSFGKE